MEKIKAIQNPDMTCMMCLSEGKINQIVIGDLGWGSGFDGWSTKINLCSRCYKETNPEWWKLNIKRKGYCEEYEFENEIFQYIRSAPLEGQELFWNRYEHGDHFPMKSQDWIDYELEILSHDKCKEYGMYSREEHKAYKDRFPTCGRVVKKVYHNGSASCWCHLNANGNADGSCGQTSIKCYRCTDYIPRKDTMEIIYVTQEFYEREIKRLQEMVVYAQTNIKRLNDNPVAYYCDPDGYNDHPILTDEQEEALYQGYMEEANNAK